MTLCSYIIDGRLIAQRSAIPNAGSHLFICPTCGRNWAQIVIEGREFFPERRPCREHRAWADAVPGSVLLNVFGIESPMTYLLSLRGCPPELLSYELEVHLAYREKELELEYASTG